MLAMLLLSQGTPMLLAGDEFGNTQLGNNNAYCQDNDIGWLEWQEIDREGSRLIDFVRRLIALRRAHPGFSADAVFPRRGYGLGPQRHHLDTSRFRRDAKR